MVKVNVEGCTIECDDNRVVVQKNGFDVVISFSDDDVSVSVRQPQRQQEQKQEREEERREEREQARREEQKSSDTIPVPSIDTNNHNRNDNIHASSSSHDVKELATQKQIKLVNMLVSQLNIQNRDERLALLSSIVKRQLSSSKELSKSEASVVIDELKNRIALKEFEQIFG